MKPVVLCILDGVGYRTESHGNAVMAAKMPTYHKLFQEYPYSLLEASGIEVGLPEGQMGNSEVGHTNIGAGRIVYQPLQLINEKIKDGSFFENEAFLEVMKTVKQNDSRLQLFGLLSDGGIHSHINHLIALLELCKKEEVKEVYLHLFLDGRDTLPDVALTYLKQIEDKCKELHLGHLATLSGRYYAMDRDNRWDRVEKAYRAIVDGIGEEYDSYEEAIKHNYEKGIQDEFLVPAVFNQDGMLREKDGLILFNFRPDRGRELFKALTNPDFQEFPHTTFEQISLVTMMPLSEEVHSKPAFQLETLTNTLGEYISSLGKKQLRIAETEKYAHVTYFFDGGVEKELEGCNRVLIPSPKVATYDLKPEMSAIEVTDRLLEELDQDYDLVILNYANGDMVGHTGSMEATIQALETLDQCLSRLEQKVAALGGVLVVTADHGNSDTMLDEENRIVTSHSTSKVPFLVTKKGISLQEGKLGDIAPTLLTLMDLPIPHEMTGQNLIKQVVPRRHYLSLIFIILSVLCMVLFVGIYGARFFHFRALEQHPAFVDTSLSGKILAPETLASSGLKLDGKTYYYQGNVDHNYVEYQGMLWRIVSINEKREIKLISDEAVTSMVWNPGDAVYETSMIRSFLNPLEGDQTGTFYHSLKNPDSTIVRTTYCSSSNGSSCEHQVEDFVGLLTYPEYERAFGPNSFLNNGTYFWLSDTTSDNTVSYVFKEGGVGSKSKMGNSYYSYGVRPVVTLHANAIYYSGDGTRLNPYQIEAPSGSRIHEKRVGDYLTYSGSLWRILSIEESGVKILKEDPIKVNDQPVERIFSSNSNQFQPNDPSSIASYLNHTFLQTLDQTKLIKGTWYLGAYDEKTNYQYSSPTSSVEAYVGLPRIGELFFSHESDLLTLTPVGTEFVAVVRPDASLYTMTTQEKSVILPAVYLNRDLEVVGGDGSKDSPYVFA